MQQSEKPLQAARQSEPASHRHAKTAANAASAQFDNSPRAVQLRATAQMLRESPQAKSLKAMAARMATHGPAPVQRMGAEEEPLQGKFETVQRMGDEEELLQGRFGTAQRMGDEEEPLQGRFESAQRMGTGENDL